MHIYINICMYTHTNKHTHTHMYPKPQVPKSRPSFVELKKVYICTLNPNLNPNLNPKHRYQSHGQALQS